jgi:signal transduction histidine kinase
MLKLSLSLLLSALCALFLLGAVLDQLANTDNHAPSQQLQLYSTLFDTISQQANQQSPAGLSSYIHSQQQHWQLTLQLVPRESLALPAELEQQLSAHGGLPLAGADGTSYLKALPAHPAWLLQLELPQEPGHRPEDLWLTLALYGGLSLIMLLWLTPLARRLWLLSQTAGKFGAGDLQARLPPSRWTYISSLEQSFNQMAQQIAQLLADNRLLASSLSHDLRTPIACFRFGLDAALEVSDPAQKNLYLQRLEQDVDRMEAMVNAFLEYASLDRQHQHWVLTPIDLTQLCQQAIQSCGPLASSRQLQIQLMAPPLQQVCGHAHWLYRVLLNLLQNACRYAHSNIELQLWQDQQQLFIRIRDDGAGIAAADAERIFLPFVRLETQSSIKPQFGLGLAIVRKVLDWHQAHISLETTAPAGASFVIRLPLPAATIQKPA